MVRNVDSVLGMTVISDCCLSVGGWVTSLCQVVATLHTCSRGPASCLHDIMLSHSLNSSPVCESVNGWLSLAHWPAVAVARPLSAAEVIRRVKVEIATQEPVITIIYQISVTYRSGCKLAATDICQRRTTRLQLVASVVSHISSVTQIRTRTVTDLLGYRLSTLSVRGRLGAATRVLIDPYQTVIVSSPSSSKSGWTWTVTGILIRGLHYGKYYL
ncbi:hypothetical protein J6590_004816 [Homalodisca vitripennis]|nr:hypothetical protein J6590_004816 [Homalodisca vitripennis]